MDYMQELYELCDTITNEIAEANEKIRAAGGKLTAGDVDYIDKLTHTLKSIKGVEQMDSSAGYSGRMYMDGNYRGYSREPGTYRGNGGGSYRGGSYARGRGSNARRDNMGRYSSDDGMVAELHELLEDAPNEAVRRDIQRLIDKMEQM